MSWALMTNEEKKKSSKVQINIKTDRKERKAK